MAVGNRAGVKPANPRGFTVMDMHTLSDFNALELEMDRAAAFLAKGLLRGPLMVHADDPLAQTRMLLGRGLTKPIAALVTKAAVAALDMSTGPGVTSNPLAAAF